MVDNLLVSNEPDECFAWVKKLTGYYASGGREPGWDFMEPERRLVFEAYVGKKYGGASCEEVYSDMEYNSFGQCTFTRDFIASVVRKRRLNAKAYLKIHGMKRRTEFKGARLDSYMMDVRMALTLFKDIDKEAAIEQIMNGLMPEKFKQMVRYHHKHIEFSDTVEDALKKIEEQGNAYQDYVDLKEHVSACEGACEQHSKNDFQKGCFNCKGDHKLSLCPEKCRLCDISCGKLMPQCPIFLDSLEREAAGPKISLPYHYKLKNAEAKKKKRSPSPAVFDVESDSDD
jgi:hypothetical protein